MHVPFLDHECVIEHGRVRPAGRGVRPCPARPPHCRLVSGAALGPLLAGLLSPSGWTNVFYMLMFADACALLVSCPAPTQAALHERLCGVGQTRAPPSPVDSCSSPGSWACDVSQRPQVFRPKALLVLASANVRSRSGTVCRARSRAGWGGGHRQEPPASTLVLAAGGLPLVCVASVG